MNRREFMADLLVVRTSALLPLLLPRDLVLITRPTGGDYRLVRFRRPWRYSCS
jgi:hypothetical protein